MRREICAGKVIYEDENSSTLEYEDGDETKLLTLDDFEGIYGDNYHMPILYRTMKQGGKVNISFLAMFVEDDGKMIWGIGTLLTDFYEINWRVYEKEPGVGTKTGGSMSTKYEQGKFELEGKWVKYYEKKDYEILFKEQLSIGQTIMSKRSLNQNISENHYELPDVMLCSKWKDCGKKMIYPCFVQRKLDGVRKLASVQNNFPVILSRSMKETKFLEHIKVDVYKIFTFLNKKFGYPKIDIWFDGEVYKHGLSLQQINGLCSRSVNTNTRQKELKYVIFDVFDGGKMSFKQRLNFLMNLKNSMKDKLKHIEFCETYLCESEEEMKQFHSIFVKEGYEGTIIRAADMPYKSKKNRDPARDWRTIKYKDFLCCEVTILDAKEDTGTKQGCVNWFVETEWGAKLWVNPAGPEIGTDTARIEAFKMRELLIGKKAVMKYFDETEDRVPKFANIIQYCRNDL